MKIARSVLTLVLVSVCASASAQTMGFGADIPGATDPPEVARFASSLIIGYRATAFEEAVIPTGPWNESAGDWKDTVKISGRRTRLVYLAPRNASSGEIIDHYRQALAAQGYQRLYQCSGFDACGNKVEQFYIDESNDKKLTDSHLLKSAFSASSVQEPRIYSARRASAEGDSHVFVFAAYQDNFADSEAGERVAIFVEQVRSERTQERLDVPDAAEMSSALAQTGRVALYAIQFDSDATSLRPQSRPQLEALARMLNEQPELKVYIVGHTDNQGALQDNLDLSRRRAEAVVLSLIQNYGILGERLTPQGVGGLSPLATNTTQDGRALNRRVEIVVQ